MYSLLYFISPIGDQKVMIDHTVTGDVLFCRKYYTNATYLMMQKPARGGNLECNRDLGIMAAGGIIPTIFTYSTVQRSYDTIPNNKELN